MLVMDTLRLKVFRKQSLFEGLVTWLHWVGGIGNRGYGSVWDCKVQRLHLITY